MINERYSEPLQSLISRPSRLGDVSPADWLDIARAVLREADRSGGASRPGRLKELDQFCWRDAALYYQLSGLHDGVPFMDISEYLGLIAEVSEEEAANWSYAKQYRRDIELTLSKISQS